MFRLSRASSPYIRLLESVRVPQEQLRQYQNETDTKNEPKDNGVHEFSREKGGVGTEEAVAEPKDPPQAGPRSGHQRTAPRTKFELFLSPFH